MSGSLKDIMQGQIEEWRSSGMSKIAFAEKAGITRHKFEYWVRKLCAEPMEEVGHRFVELRPKDQTVKVASVERPSAQGPQPQVELTFPDGTCLKVYI